jgi:hypothetical protein
MNQTILNTLSKVFESKIFTVSVLLMFFAIFLHSHKHNVHKELIGIHMWRQTYTQLNVQQFYRNDFNILNPRVNTLNGEGNIKRLEFPIMQWTIAGVMKIIGNESLLITRLYIAFITFCSFIGLYQLARLISQNKMASLMVAGLFLCSPLVFYYGISPIPDNLALMAAIWFCYYFLKYQQSHFTNVKLGIFSACFISIASLAKLPYAIFGSMALMAILYERNTFLKWSEKTVKRHLLIFSIALLPSIIWYGSIIHTWGTESIVGGILNGMSLERVKLVLLHHWNFTSKDFLFNQYTVYGFYISLPITAYGLIYSKSKFKPYLITLALSIILYFIYELNMIDIIHDYYMMPFLVLLYLMVLYTLHLIYKYNKLIFASLFIFSLLMPTVTYKQSKNYFSAEKAGMDPTLASHYMEMRNLVPKDEKCIILNDDSGSILPYFFDKEGYVFNKDAMQVIWMDDMIRNKEAKYMYCNSRKIEGDSLFPKFIDKLIWSKGNFNIFKLKDPKDL